MSCPSEEIAEHADQCAEAAVQGFLQSHVTYGSLVMQEIDIPEVVFDSSSTNGGTATTIVECLVNLRKNVKEENTKIYVRRKQLWEDFVHVTKNCKWFHPQNNIKVVFVGEPAIDGGGPKREFFTGKCFKSLCLLNSCVSVPFTYQYIYRLVLLKKVELEHYTLC
jgi:hypothetical protein